MDSVCAACGYGEECGGLQKSDCCGMWFHHDEPCMSRLGITGFHKRSIVAPLTCFMCVPDAEPLANLEKNDLEPAKKKSATSLLDPVK